MQLLQPAAELGDDDLETAYGYPAERTWTRLNMVTSLDGATTDRAGRADGLSSPADQRVFHLLRSLADVVVVGAGTARVEGYEPVRRHEVDAALRDRLGLAPLPPIVVVSRRLDVPDALLADADDPGARTVVVTTASAPADRLAALRESAEVLLCGHDRVDHGAVRDALAARGLRRILCEGGPMLAGTMTAAGAVDEICLTLGAQLVAGQARRMTNAPPIDPPQRMRLAHAIVADQQLLLRYVRAETP